MVLQCLGPAVPQTVLVRLGSPPQSPARMEVLQSNAGLARLVERLAWPRVSVTSVRTRQGHQLEVKLYLPAQLRPGQQEGVPLLLYT